jgi:hypothetical protein
MAAELGECEIQLKVRAELAVRDFEVQTDPTDIVSQSTMTDSVATVSTET